MKKAPKDMANKHVKVTDEAIKKLQETTPGTYDVELTVTVRWTLHVSRFGFSWRPNDDKAGSHGHPEMFDTMKVTRI